MVAAVGCIEESQRFRRRFDLLLEHFPHKLAYGIGCGFTRDGILTLIEFIVFCEIPYLGCSASAIEAFEDDE